MNINLTLLFEPPDVFPVTFSSLPDHIGQMQARFFVVANTPQQYPDLRAPLAFGNGSPAAGPAAHHRTFSSGSTGPAVIWPFAVSMPILSKTKTTHCSANVVHPPVLPALRAWDDSCRALVAHRLERSSWFLEFAVHATYTTITTAQ